MNLLKRETMIGDLIDAVNDRLAADGTFTLVRDNPDGTKTWRYTAMTDDLEKQADETEPEPAETPEPSDGEAGTADAEPGVEPESEPSA